MDESASGTDPMMAEGGGDDGANAAAGTSGTEVPPASPEVYDGSSAQPAVVVEQGGVVVVVADAAAPAAAVLAATVTGETGAAAGTAAVGVYPPTDRDVVLGGEDGMGRVSALLVDDLIRIHRLLWTLHGKSDPGNEAEVLPLAKHLVDMMKNGREFELAGLSDVPKPFLKSKGRFLRFNPSTNQYNDVPDTEAERALATMIFNQFTTDNLGDLDEVPYKNLRLWLSRQEEKNMENAEFMPEAIDAILLPCGDYLAEKMYENQGGNRMIFNLASQYVNCYVGSSMKRVAAALEIMTGLDDVTMDHSGKNREMTTTRNVRFLTRRQTSESAVTWDIMDPASAAEFCVMFVFEVFLEKDLHIQLPLLKPEAVFTLQKPGTVPVHNPVDDDVLFGRGGMTNGHPGNRRFRDIIALHRPDYVRAQKMDKPSVAIKIIRAIRSGGPQPGRFLKKRDDGLWYDVGDRAAMEKTSQGLRERTNAEKRQRSALREALRIRKQDLSEGAETPRKKSKLTDMEEYAEAGMAPLNYVGTNLSVPLSLAMKDPGSLHEQIRKKSIVKDETTKVAVMELNTEGLPPNAVDEEGNILVTDYDILCGRGGLTNHHKGNKRFRDIVALHRPDYVRAPKIQKPSVARVIVRAIRNGDPPGRFLRKDDITGKWIDIGDKKAAEKTSQALREKTGDEKGMTSPEGLASLLPNHPAPYTLNPSVFASLGQPIQLLDHRADGHHQKEDVKVEDMIVVPSPMIGDMPDPTIIHGNAKAEEDDDDDDNADEHNVDI